MIIESLVLEALHLLQKDMPAYEVQCKCGIEAHAEAVKRLKEQPSLGNMTPQQFFAKQEADKQEFFRKRTAQGNKPQRVNQQDHNCIVGTIFDRVDAGDKPAVRPMLEAYGKERGYSPDWAKRVSAQTHPRKMSKTLAAYKSHPVLQDLKKGRMLSQTHKSALQHSTYSGLTEFLFSGTQNVRHQRAVQQRMEALEAELGAVKAEAGRANARLDLKDQGKDWREAARTIRIAEPGISNRKLAGLVGVSEAAIRKYLGTLKTLLPAVP